VQVTALGHACKKGVQGERAGCACLLHAGCGLLLRRGDLRIGRKKMKQKAKQQSKLREAASAESSFRGAPRSGLTPAVSFPERTATRTDY
jgi:hypothetical protein